MVEEVEEEDEGEVRFSSFCNCVKLIIIAQATIPTNMESIMTGGQSIFLMTGTSLCGMT